VGTFGAFGNVVVRLRRVLLCFGFNRRYWRDKMKTFKFIFSNNDFKSGVVKTYHEMKYRHAFDKAWNKCKMLNEMGWHYQFDDVDEEES
jgi:hypothetical protein